MGTYGECSVVLPPHAKWQSASVQKHHPAECSIVLSPLAERQPVPAQGHQSASYSLGLQLPQGILLPHTLVHQGDQLVPV